MRPSIFALLFDASCLKEGQQGLEVGLGVPSCPCLQAAPSQALKGFPKKKKKKKQLNQCLSPAQRMCRIRPCLSPSPSPALPSR